VLLSCSLRQCVNHWLYVIKLINCWELVTFNETKHKTFLTLPAAIKWQSNFDCCCTLLMHYCHESVSIVDSLLVWHLQVVIWRQCMSELSGSQRGHATWLRRVSMCVQLLSESRRRQSTCMHSSVQTFDSFIQACTDRVQWRH